MDCCHVTSLPCAAVGRRDAAKDHFPLRCATGQDLTDGRLFGADDPLRVRAGELYDHVAHWSDAVGIVENRGVQNYAVVIHEDPEGRFWAEVPALPGCYSQGETVDELKHNIREAIAGVLEVLREQGREPDSNIRILDVAV